jgi:hypothetical protein
MTSLIKMMMARNGDRHRPIVGVGHNGGHDL